MPRRHKACSTLVRNGSAECRLLWRGAAHTAPVRLPKPPAVMASRLSSVQGASAQADHLKGYDARQSKSAPALGAAMAHGWFGWL